MNSEELLGIVGMSTMIVRAADTSVAAGVNDLPVLSMSSAQALIESACSAALAEYFAPGETSFTLAISIEMATSISVGEEARAHVRLIEVNESLVTFEAAITHLNKTIATAQVQRRLIERLSFMARIAAERIVSA
jgi:fluoroacetyl-CoA thioesterase